MILYNSATRKREEFVPNNPDLVKMYTCGPTVYHFAHIGNLRFILRQARFFIRKRTRILDELTVWCYT